MTPEPSSATDPRVAGASERAARTRPTDRRADADERPAPGSRRTAAQRNSLVGLASLAGVLASWSFGPTLTKRVHLYPVVASFLRIWLACALHWIICAAFRILPSRALVKRSFIPGVLFCCNSMLFFFALGHASVAAATLLSSLQPAVVLLAAGPLFHERVTRSDVAWTMLAVSAAGFAVLAANSEGATRTSALGVIYTLGSMLAFTGYFLAAKLQNTAGGLDQTAPGRGPRTPPNPFTYMAAVLVGSSAGAVPFLLTSGHVHDLAHLRSTDLRAISLVITVPAIGHVCMALAHRYVDATLSSLAMLIQPLTSGLVAWWLLGQRLVSSQVIGGVMVILALAAMTLTRRSRNTAAA